MVKKKAAKKKTRKSEPTKPDLPPQEETENPNPPPQETEAEDEQERPEMPVKEALNKFKELRKYVSMAGEFRSGLTKEELAEGEKMVRQLNIKDCKPTGTSWDIAEKESKKNT